MALYSYVLRYDTGIAPNPYGGVCTLTVCKPAIRRTAQVGDWIIGTGSRRSLVGDIAGFLVYAMKVSRCLSLAGYDAHCRRELPIKIPGHPLHRHQRENAAGDSLYDYSQPDQPRHRGGPVHQEPWLQERDWRGRYALLADEFYYFGREPRPLPRQLHFLVKRGRGHHRRTAPGEIAAFEQWLQAAGFEKNRLYADPQAPVWQQAGPQGAALLVATSSSCG